MSSCPAQPGRPGQARPEEAGWLPTQLQAANQPEKPTRTSSLHHTYRGVLQTLVIILFSYFPLTQLVRISSDFKDQNIILLT